jgi:hypothetical protein
MVPPNPDWTAGKKEFSIETEVGQLDINEPIGKGTAKLVRTELKRKTKAKFEIDLELCRWLFWTQNAYVNTKNNTSLQLFYKYLGYDTWGQYVEQDLGISASEARQLVMVHQTYCILYAKQWNPKKHSLHISKLIALIPILTEENFEDILEQAGNISTDDFKALTSNNVQNHKRSVTYSYPESNDKYRVKAFKSARKMFGDDLTESALFIEILKLFVKEHAK